MPTLFNLKKHSKVDERMLRFCGTASLACRDGDRAVSCSNIIYLVVGALVIVVVVMGYQLYRDPKKPEGVRIDVGPNGLSIEKK